MKWGVRKDKPRGKIRRGATKANVALDAGGNVIKKGQEKLIFLPQKQRNKAASATQTRVLAEAAAINQDARFKGKDIKHDAPLRAAYHKEVEKRALKIYQEELGEARAEALVEFVESFTSPRQDSVSFSVPRDRVRHAEEVEEILLTLFFVKNELGHIVGIDIPEDALGHSGDLEVTLAHYGVKGMKWGVRNDGTPHTRRSAKKEAKADAKWEKSIYSMKGAIAVHNNVADRMNAQLDAFNNQPKYKDKNLYDDPALEKEYFAEYSKMTEKAYGEAVRAVHGSSPSGKKEAIYRQETENLPARIEVRDKNVEHAEFGDAEPDLIILLKRNATGHVIETNQAQLKHAEESEKFLAHYGVKGMKWGVRKNDGPVDVVVSQKKPGTRVRAEGGKRQPASEDAKKAAAARQKAKASTTDSLSNQELKALVERMQLEANYTRLSATQKGLGRKFVEKLFKDPKTRSQTAEAAGKTLDVISAPKQVGDAIKRTDLSNIGK